MNMEMPNSQAENTGGNCNNFSENIFENFRIPTV